MITHLASVTVYVSDQDRALDFYINALGFERRVDVTVDANPAPEVTELVHWVEVAPKGSQATLVLIPQQFDSLRSGKVTGQFTDIQFFVDDMQATVDDLRQWKKTEYPKTGARFSFEPERVVFGWRAELLDPDGNAFNLIQLDPSFSSR